MKKDQPNVVIYFTDDQGYGDLSCMGAKDFSTPVLDRMANEGITSCYAHAFVGKCFELYCASFYFSYIRVLRESSCLGWRFFTIIVFFSVFFI